MEVSKQNEIQILEIFNYKDDVYYIVNRERCIEIYTNNVRGFIKSAHCCLSDIFV